MPNEENTNTGVNPPVAAPTASDAVADNSAVASDAVADNSSALNDNSSVAGTADSDNLGDNNPVNDDRIVEKVADRIKDADSILVTLSKDPSVDEMAAAIGLTLTLDKMGKHATAIYSGKTPNALEFLEPKKTFETNTNSLQDFIIALNKDKADHLRYKIEDEFVKVYITPYRTTIDEKDLQFSHGDINVDLVISLNVKDVNDLDAALAKHGRIMHDAAAVNISNDTPGKLGGIEWDDMQASSASEMIVKLVETLGEEMSEDIATALLTGVVSATDRFSNDKTTPEAMEVSAKLMESGANQQLVAINIEKKGEKAEPEPEEKADEHAIEGTILDIARDKKKDEPETVSPEEQLEQMVGGSLAEDNSVEGNSVEGPTLMDELKAATPEVAPEVPEAPEVAPEVVTPEVVSEPAEPKPSAEETLLNAVPAEQVETNKPELSPEEVLKNTVPDVASTPEATPAINAATAMPNTAPVINAPASMPEAEAPKAAMPTSTEPLFGEQQISPMNSTIDGQVVIPSDQGEKEAAVASGEMSEDGVYQTAGDMTNLQDGTIEPLQGETSKNYGEMMEKELAEANNNPAIGAAPIVPNTPEVQPVAEPMVSTGNVELPPAEQMMAPENIGMSPAGQAMAPENIELPQAPAPQVPGVDAAGATIDAALPPVQPVPIDESAAAGVPAAPEGIEQEAPKEELNPVIIQPEPVKEPKQIENQEEIQNPVQEPVQDPASVPPVADPGAFKIPGM